MGRPHRHRPRRLKVKTVMRSVAAEEEAGAAAAAAMAAEQEEAARMGRAVTVSPPTRLPLQEIRLRPGIRKRKDTADKLNTPQGGGDYHRKDKSVARH